MISLRTRLELMRLGDVLYTGQGDQAVQSHVSKFIKPERKRFKVRTTRLRGIPPAGADLSSIEDITRVERIA